MALASLTAYFKPPALDVRGSTLPFDGVVEFSRNERSREVVSLFIIPTPNDATLAGEEITIRIMKGRRDRNEEVVQARQVVTFTGAVPAAGHQVDFDLRRINYSAEKPFPMMRRGDYFFDIEHSGGTTGPSSVEAQTRDFRVSLMTVDQFDREWVLGTTRRSNDDRMVRFQPREILGVKIVEISRNHPLDVFDLNLSWGAETPPNAYLSWAGGEVKKIDLTPLPQEIGGGIHKQYILRARTRVGYITVEVDPTMLPTESMTEDLLVDRLMISRESLRRWLDEETDWLEQSYLYTPLEPALCVSDYSLSTLSPAAGNVPSPVPLPTNFDYDIKGYPMSYYPANAGHWIDLQVPYSRPLHWEYLVGALESTRIVDINPKWIHTSSDRIVKLVPFNQSLAYHFIGLIFVQALRGPAELPSFWRYRYWAGVEEETTPLELIEAIGMRAAVKSLTVLGQMFRGGFSSQSMSRDGVSESASYTSSAMYGIYSASMEEYKKRLEEILPQLKRKYFGLYINVL